MAGRGAPDVSQARTTDMPSITVLSRGPLVMLGAMPAGGDEQGLRAAASAERPRVRRSSWRGAHRCPDGAPALARRVEDPQKLP